MYRYKTLEWSGPLSSTPSSLPHMETGPATAGVNAGDRVNGYNVTNDPDNMIHLRLVSMSNVGVPGLFVYRIDLGTSKSQSCAVISLLSMTIRIVWNNLLECTVTFISVTVWTVMYVGVNAIIIRDRGGWMWV